MKNILIIFISFFIFWNFVFANDFIKTKVDNHTFRVIKYDTKDERYNYKIWVNLDYHASSLRKLMEKFNAISAVNWVFLCPADYKECDWQNFTRNERYFMWYKIAPENSTWQRVVFAVDKNKKPFLFQTDKINKYSEKSIYYGFSNFPLLLQNWVSKVWDYDLDFKMSIKTRRNFVCSDKTKRYIYFWFVDNISLRKIPEVLKKFGCYDALNLDAGKTSSMIYNWRQIIWPGRELLDWILIERKWLNTKKILEKTDIILNKFKNILEKKSLEEKIKITWTINKAISNYRKKIYEKNSIDLYDENGKNIGYEIKMDSINNLSVMYILNILNREIYQMNKDFQKQYKWENLLF